MSISEEAIFEKLKNVIDPELFVNVVDLGLIYGVKLKPAGATPVEAKQGEKVAGNVGAGNAAAGDLTPGDSPGAKTVGAETSAASVPIGERSDVFIEMTMTSPACPAGPQLISGAKREVASIAGVGEVQVKIVLDPPWTPDRMTEDAKDQLGIF